MRRAKWNTINALKYGAIFGILTTVLNHLTTARQFFARPIAYKLGAVLGAVVVVPFLFWLVAVIRNSIVGQAPAALDLPDYKAHERLEPDVAAPSPVGAAPLDAAGDDASAHASGAMPASPKTPGWRVSRYIRNHWLGKMSLARSYWVNNVLISVFLSILIKVYSANLPLNPTVAQSVILISVCAFAIVPFPVWSLVGTWRAATRDRVENKRALLPGLAKVAIVLGFMSIIVNIGKSVPVLTDLVRMYRGDSDLAFKVQLDGNEIFLNGYITLQSAREIMSFINHNDDVKLLDLASGGGRIKAAMDLTDELVKRHFDTYARGDCLSACTIVFLSGHNRMIFKGARLGFHQISEAGLNQAELLQDQEKMRKYYLQQGLPPWFVEKAMSSPASDMWYPTLDELIKAHAITHVYDNKTIQKVN